jgi:nitrite reductase/ring-hydroxylating ferredoxin subunit
MGRTLMATTETNQPAPKHTMAGRELPTGGMPRRPELCLDPSTRQRVRTDNGARFPFPVPNGWFIVAMADDVLAGELKAIRYFGRDLVAFRDDNGVAHVVDAYCVHLGAHLAAGGKVEGECIRCPFHGWAYNGVTGKCVDIPYYGVEKIPSQAQIRAFPTVERNRAIWAWHHLAGAEPFYEVPDVAEFNDQEWSEPVLRRFEIATSCQEMAENNHDPVHFQFVHGTADIPVSDITIEGTYKRSIGLDGAFVRESFGLGLGVLRIAGYSTFISSTTPIDEEHVDVRWFFTSPKSLGPDTATEIADGFTGAVSQDLPIWENKRYVERPILLKAERAILEHREWCKQFYS